MINTPTLQYISAHASDDVAHLALHPSKDPQVDMPMALQQIAGRQKAMEKLPEWYENPDILYPKKVSMEQCSSSQTADYKASLVEGNSFADLSGGFGVDTIALARKFEKGYYVEPQEELCELFQHNCKAFGINHITVINKTLEESFDQLEKVDVMYVDPSRRDVHGRRVVALEDCVPNLLEWKERLLEKCNTLMVKLSPMIDLHQILRQLPEVSVVHVVAVEGECKEVVCLLNEKTVTDVQVVAIDLHNNNNTLFNTTLQTERSAPLSIATEMGTYLYEPNAAVMKAGIFNSISQQFQIQKLEKNTNLFTSNELREDFPGRIFRIEAVHEFHPRKTAKEVSHLESASIAVRNFPLTAEELRKTLKIKDGNACYLFGCTLSGNKKCVIQCRKH
jgi:precorrin-6B methylase 2